MFIFHFLKNNKIFFLCVYEVYLFPLKSLFLTGEIIIQ